MVYSPNIENFQISDLDKHTLQRNRGTDSVYYQLHQLYAIFEKHWGLVRCFVLLLDDTYADNISNNYNLSIYRPFAKLTQWYASTKHRDLPSTDDFRNTEEGLKISTQNHADENQTSEMNTEIHDHGHEESEDGTFEEHETSAQNDIHGYVTLSCHEFLQSNVANKVRAVWRHVDDAVTFVCGVESISSEIIKTFKLDPSTVSFLLAQRDPKQQAIFIKALCESVYRLLFLIILRVAPNWGKVQIHRQRYAELFFKPAQVGEDEDTFEREHLSITKKFASVEEFINESKIPRYYPRKVRSKNFQKIHTNVRKIVYKHIHKYKSYIKKIAQTLGVSIQLLPRQKFLQSANAKALTQNIIDWVANSIEQSCKEHRSIFGYK